MQLRKILTRLCFAFLPLLSGTGFAADNSAVLGKWDLEFDVQGQTIAIALTVAEGQNGLEGTWAGPQGSTPVSNVSFDGELLKFSRTGPQGQALDMSFTVTGDTLSGVLNSPAGELPVTGKKSS